MLLSVLSYNLKTNKTFESLRCDDRNIEFSLCYYYLLPYLYLQHINNIHGISQLIFCSI